MAKNETLCFYCYWNRLFECYMPTSMDADLLPAIREDHNPLALVGLLGGLRAAPLIFLRWTSYGCPHCGRTFRRDFWQYNVWLGSGKRVCRQCGKFFDDGTREWPDLPLAKKLRFLFPPLLVAVCGGFVLAAILSLFVAPRDEHSWLIVVLVSAFGLAPVILWCPVRLILVVRSNRRYRRVLAQDPT
jgi:hypothetical protein